MDVPLKAIDVGFLSGIYAFYLYSLPLWNLFLGVMEEKNKNDDTKPENSLV